MNFNFEDRLYDKYEIIKKFSIKEKTWKNWLYDTKTGKKKNLADMGIYKLPGNQLLRHQSNRISRVVQ